MKLGDRCLVEGFANRLKDPLVRVSDGVHQTLIRLAVDIEETPLAAVVDAPPMGPIVEHGTERHANEIRIASDAAGRPVV